MLGAALAEGDTQEHRLRMAAKERRCSSGDSRKVAWELPRVRLGMVRVCAADACSTRRRVGTCHWEWLGVARFKPRHDTVRVGSCGLVCRRRWVSTSAATRRRRCVRCCGCASRRAWQWWMTPPSARGWSARIWPCASRCCWRPGSLWRGPGSWCWTVRTHPRRPSRSLPRCARRF